MLKNWLKPPLNSFFEKFHSFIEKKRKHTSIFYIKNNRKHLAIAIKHIKICKNRISFIKDVEITDEKAETLYSALRNENEKYGGVQS